MVVPVRSRTDRLMARIALIILTCGLLYGVSSFSGPVYWRFYSEYIRPYYSRVSSHHPVLLNGTSPSGAFGANETSPALKIDAPKERPAPPGSKNSENAAPQVKESSSVPADAQVAKTDSKDGGEPTVKKEEPKEEKKETPTKLPRDPSAPIKPEDYHLTPELVLPHVKDNMVMITWANHHYLDFAKNWVFHLRKVGVTELMVGAMDDEMLTDLVRLDIPTWRMNTNITKNDLGWGSANFHSMGRAKIKLIQQFLSLTGNLTVIISDIDTAWMRSPMKYFQSYPTADILTSTDELRPTVKDESLELFPASGASFNIGIMLFRPSSRSFVEEWVKELVDPKMWDQTAFNNLARRGHGKSEAPNNLWKGYGASLSIGILPSSVFCSGHTFFVQHKYREFGLQPYVAHATFQYSGTVGKRHRFREALLWDDPPAYFDPADGKGFIHFDIPIPVEMWEAAKEPVKGPLKPELVWNHFSLVNYQLTHLRYALAIATITNRILVLPPIWCQIDKYWAPLFDGNIPGSEFRKPFICPADHVLDLEGNWAPVHGPPDGPFGPHIEFREYSFLQNSRLPASVNDSRVAVVLCGDGEKDCADGSGPAKIEGSIARVLPRLNSTALEAALASTAKYRMLYFPSLADVFGGFAEPEKRQRFVRRLQHYPSVTCCLESPQFPGWLWYDFFSDVPDHKDRFGRVASGTSSFDAEERVIFAGDSPDVKFTIRNPNPPHLRRLTLPGYTGETLMRRDGEKKAAGGAAATTTAAADGTLVAKEGGGEGAAKSDGATAEKKKQEEGGGAVEGKNEAGGDKSIKKPPMLPYEF